MRRDLLIAGRLFQSHLERMIHEAIKNLVVMQFEIAVRYAKGIDQCEPRVASTLGNSRNNWTTLQVFGLQQELLVSFAA